MVADPRLRRSKSQHGTIKKYAYFFLRSARCKTRTESSSDSLPDPETGSRWPQRSWDVALPTVAGEECSILRHSCCLSASPRIHATPMCVPLFGRPSPMSAVCCGLASMLGRCCGTICMQPRRCRRTTHMRKSAKRPGGTIPSRYCSVWTRQSRELLAY